MKYKSKRIKSRLSLHYVANKLGLTDKVYKEVEKGVRALEGSDLDKFLQIVETDAKTNYIENTVAETTAYDWYINKTVAELDRLKKTFGVTLIDIADTLGLDKSTLSRLFTRNWADGHKPNKAHIHALHDYFNNTINKKYVSYSETRPVEKEVKSDEIEKVEVKSTTSRYNIDWNELFNVCNIDYKTLAKLLNKAPGNVKRWLTGIYEPSLNNIHSINQVIIELTDGYYDINDFSKNIYVKEIEDNSIIEVTEDDFPEEIELPKEINEEVVEEVSSDVSGDVSGYEEYTQEEASDMARTLNYQDNRIKALETQLKRYEILIDLLGNK